VDGDNVVLDTGEESFGEMGKKEGFPGGGGRGEECGEPEGEVDSDRLESLDCCWGSY